MITQSWTRAGMMAAAVAVSMAFAGQGTTRGAASIGIFDAQGDVGVPSTMGQASARYDAASKTYTIAGGGENMWARADHFRFVWTKVSGDVALSAAIRFAATQPSGTPNEHRKACLVLRQSLDADAVYVDAATHGNGMTSLQWRAAKGDVSHDIETNVVGPARLRIEKRGDTVAMFVAEAGAPWRPAGGSTRVHLEGEFYVGLGVSAHDTGRIETAAFSDVELGAPAPLGPQARLVSTIETISLGSKDRRVALVSQVPEPVEAPVWFPDASATLYFSRAGGVFKVQADLPRAAPNPAGPRAASRVDIGGLTAIGHDHALSRDGQAWVVTDHAPATAASAPSQLFVAPAAGGPARRVPVPSPAYARGFSPDGQLLIYAAERGGNLDVYTIARAGGPEHRLTTSPARDDGPEFSPDGAFIYFNSDRGGSMQVWRMKADGTSPEPLTSGDRANWCPHVSPDGRTLVFLSAPPAAGDRFDPADVVLRRMSLADRVVDDLATFYGGKGTMNVASFAPTSQHLAFVSYQRVPADVPVSVDRPR